MDNLLATPEMLIDYGFEEKVCPVMTNYRIDVSLNKYEFKELSVSLDKGNQYVMIRQGSLKDERYDDDVVTLLNGDYTGAIKIQNVLDLYKIITGKELIKINKK